MSMSHTRPAAFARVAETQLHDFRRRVWTIKMAEAAAVATFGVVLALLCVFALDRVTDTPGWAADGDLCRRGRRMRRRADLSAPLDLAPSAVGTAGPAAQPALSQHRRPDAGHYRAGA